MRILTVCTSTNVFGAEVITLKMLEGFKRAGHELLAVTSTWTDGEFNQRLATIEVPEVRLPFGAFSKRLSLRPMWWTANVVVRTPWLWSGWIRIIRSFKPDIIIFTSIRLVMPVYMFLPRAPSFLIEHANLEPTRTRRLIYPLLAKRLSGFIAVSNFTGEHLKKLGAPADKIHVIRNGLFSLADHAAITACEWQGSLATHKNLRVGIVGQIAPSKGHETLLEATKLLHERDLPVEVHIFGRGEPSYIRDLSRRVARYRLTEFWRWMGYESDRTVIYRGLGICVMPSSSEAFGMVAAEAGAYGLPVVASDVGGLREVVEEGVTGFLVRPNDPVALSDKISWLLQNPAAAAAMGASGRARVFKQFTVEKMVRQFEDVFRQFVPSDVARQISEARVSTHPE